MTEMTSQPAKKTGSGRAIAIIVVVVIVVAAIGAYFLLYSKGSTAQTNSKIMIANGTAASGTLTFSPNSVTVVLGKNNTLVFSNNDITNHTIIFTSAPSGVSLNSISDSNLLPGATYTVTLSTAGTYNYMCNIHPWMTGTITVKSS